MGREHQAVFETQPVFKAILRLALPTMIGQVILVLYNMADTFFIGLTGSDAMLAAVTVSTPAFMFLSAISNLFGVGGASAIARALGKKDRETAGQCASFSFYGCLTGTLIYSLLVGIFLHQMVSLLGGTNALVHRYACMYMRVTVIIGGVCTSMNALLAHLIRSEGRAMHASAGIALGGIFNIILDPVFMFILFTPGNELLGAAVATALSNLLALFYFGIVLLKIRRKTVLSIKWTPAVLRTAIPGEILRIGLPACMMTFCENISFSVMDALTATHGLAFQAGFGVAKKVNMLAHCMVRGISQGVLPLIAYNYAAGKKQRMHSVITASVLLATGLAALCTAASLLFSHPLISLFIHHESPSLNHGMVFLRMLCLGCPFSALAYVLISVFQAVNDSVHSLILALLRKGILDIPLLFVFNRLMPPYGLAWATPAADLACALCAVVLYEVFRKRISPGTAGTSHQVRETVSLRAVNLYRLK